VHVVLLSSELLSRRPIFLNFISAIIFKPMISDQYYGYYG